MTDYYKYYKDKIEAQDGTMISTTYKNKLTKLDYHYKNKHMHSKISSCIDKIVNFVQKCINTK